MSARKKNTKAQRGTRGGYRPGAGRKPTGTATDAWLTVRVRRELLDQIRAAADGSGQSVPELVRGILRDFCDLQEST